MNDLRRILRGQGGFMLLNVVLLTLITSFAAMILLNAATRVRNRQSTLELTALYLANEQLAQLESAAAAGGPLSGGYLGDPDDLTTTNAGAPITFNVATDINGNGSLRRATVTVTWKVDGEDFEFVAERTILIAQQTP